MTRPKRLAGPVAVLLVVLNAFLFSLLYSAFCRNEREQTAFSQARAVNLASTQAVRAAKDFVKTAKGKEYSLLRQEALETMATAQRESASARWLIAEVLLKAFAPTIALIVLSALIVRHARRLDSKRADSA